MSGASTDPKRHLALYSASLLGEDQVSAFAHRARPPDDGMELASVDHGRDLGQGGAIWLDDEEDPSRPKRLHDAGVDDGHHPCRASQRAGHRGGELATDRVDDERGLAEVRRLLVVEVNKC